MAQQDTGLGWSAKNEWLVSANDFVTASIPARIIWDDTPGQPLPVATTRADIIANGFLFYERDEGDGLRHHYYIAASIPNSVLVYCPVYDPSNRVIGWNGITNVSGAEYYIVDDANPNYFNTSRLEYSIGDGYYSNRWDSSSQAGSNLVKSAIFPVYTSQTIAKSHVVPSAPIDFIKVNSGYAVACLCRWKTPNNTLMESPILISTETEFVEMSTSESGISLAKLNILYDGRKFYMGFYARPYTGALTSVMPEIDRSYSDAPTFTLEQLFRYIAKNVYANILVTDAPDPYNEESEEGGGDGEEDEQDNIDFTDTPSTAIGATGFLTIFCPSLGQLQNLAHYMWTTFDPDNWRKVIANPMDAILGLNIIPVPPHITGTKTISVAGVSTEIEMDYTSLRYIKRPMGSCDIPKKWGSYLDYNPYTKCSIFLPYIGFQELNVDDIMGQTISLQYIIDILTGACVAELKCGDTVLYSWTGNCANPVPIASASWNTGISSALTIAATVAGLALTGGASSAMIPGAIASIGANSMNLKPNVSRSGSIGGSSGFIGGQRPYIVRTIPNLVIPADQNKFIGYPSFVTASLGSLTGYNEISAIHLEGIPATGNELSEIETLLKGGVIF